jgi:hypothetical protein
MARTAVLKKALSAPYVALSESNVAGQNEARND